MTNFERVSDEQKKIMMRDNWGVSKYNNEPVPCNTLRCSHCKFGITDVSMLCSQNRTKWLDEEYVKYQIPVNTSVDERVEVSEDGKEWHKRCFSGRFSDIGEALIWDDGKNSWTVENDTDVTAWKYCRLAD